MRRRGLLVFYIKSPLNTPPRPRSGRGKASRYHGRSPCRSLGEAQVSPWSFISPAFLWALRNSAVLLNKTMAGFKINSDGSGAGRLAGLLAGRQVHPRANVAVAEHRTKFCRGGGNGIRAALRTLSRKGCGSESHPRHRQNLVRGALASPHRSKARYGASMSQQS